MSDPLVSRGPRGARPAHQWVGTLLKVQNPDGSYDAGVDLKGPAGASTVEAQAAADASAASAATATTQAGIATAQASAAAASAGVFIAPPAGRLTLTSGTPVITTNVVGATTIYYTPCVGRTVPIYNGTAYIATLFTELSLPLDNQAAHTGYHVTQAKFDAFVINDAGTVRLATGPGWASATRGTGAGTTEIEFYDGFWVNKNAITARFGASSGNTVSVPARRATYVGTFFMTADGMTEDSATRCFVYNAYNPAPRKLARVDPAAQWTTDGAGAYRYANGLTANKIEFVLGLPGVMVEAECFLTALSLGGVGSVYTNIGIDGLSTMSSDPSSLTSQPLTTSIVNISGRYRGYPGIGYHYLVWSEYSTANNIRIYGSGNGSGISGRFLG